MVGRHHWLNGHEFEQVWEMVKDREAWHAAVHGVAKSGTWLSRLNNKARIQEWVAISFSSGSSRSRDQTRVSCLAGRFAEPPGKPFIYNIHVNYGASLVALVVKNLPVNTGDVRDPGSVPRLGQCPGGGNGNLLQYSCLENLIDRGAWWATIHRVAKSWSWLKWLSTHACSVNYIYYVIHCISSIYLSDDGKFVPFDNISYNFTFPIPASSNQKYNLFFYEFFSLFACLGFLCSAVGKESAC